VEEKALNTFGFVGERVFRISFGGTVNAISILSG